MKNLTLAFAPTDGVLEIKEPEYPFRLVCDFSESELNTKTDEELEHAKRIVECVNACAGIENPGETIRELVEALEAIVPKPGYMPDWWCPCCKELKDGSRVTYGEHCEDCGTYIGDVQPNEEWIVKAHAVLAKAKGGAE